MSEKEPTIRNAALREAEREIHIGCRFADGQKFAAVTVDESLPGLAGELVDFINHSAGNSRQDSTGQATVTDAHGFALLTDLGGMVRILGEADAHLAGDIQWEVRRVSRGLKALLDSR